MSVLKTGVRSLDAFHHTDITWESFATNAHVKRIGGVSYSRVYSRALGNRVSAWMYVKLAKRNTTS